jgi:hypothetical protein
MAGPAAASGNTAPSTNTQSSTNAGTTTGQTQPPANPGNPGGGPAATATGTNQPAGPSAKGFEFPKPNEFTGAVDRVTGSTEAREWIASVKAYLQFHKISDESQQVYFALHLCKKKAYQWASIYIKWWGTTPTPETQEYVDVGQDWGKFEDRFFAQFATGNLSQVASDIIHDKLTYDKEKGIAEFAAKFRELANQTDWNNEAKRQTFRAILPPWIKSKLVSTTNVPRDYEEFVDFVVQIVEQQENFDGNTGRRNQNISAAQTNTYNNQRG